MGAVFAFFYPGFRDGNREIYVMDANGFNPTNLTTHSGVDLEPVWSGCTPPWPEEKRESA